jgi:hypothetical protein
MSAFMPFINIVAFVATLVINYLSQTPLLNGVTTAEIANRFPDSLYFPANQAFSIWGLIYSFLLAYLINQAIPSQRNNPLLKRIGWLFVVTNVFNAAWVLAFQFSFFPLSVVFMLALLGTLLTIYVRLDIGGAPVSLRDKWLVHIPFSIYLGWITAATIANITYVLTDLGWDGFGLGNETWAVIMLVVTGLVGAFVVWTRRDIAYGLVIVWAVGWIAGRYNGTEFQLTTTTALVVAAVIAVLVIVRFIMSLRGGASGSSLRTTRAAA